MTEKPPLPKGEMGRVLVRLESLVDERKAVLVGGQAVSFWASYLSRPGLRLPIVATKDIDFEGPRTVAQRAGKLLDAEVRIPKASDRTPLTGVVTFIDSKGDERQLDFIEAPRGLNAQDVRDTAVEVTATDPDSRRKIAFWALHPERSMESRIYNVIDLRRTAPLSMDQLAVSIDSAREWSRVVLEDSSLPKLARRRAVLKLNERIFKKCRSDRCFRAVHKRHGVDPFDAVLVHDDLPQKFRRVRYPQMQAALEAARAGAR